VPELGLVFVPEPFLMYLYVLLLTQISPSSPCLEYFHSVWVTATWCTMVGAMYGWPADGTHTDVVLEWSSPPSLSWALAGVPATSASPNTAATAASTMKSFPACALDCVAIMVFSFRSPLDRDSSSGQGRKFVILLGHRL
jgi:hypothetical protein